MINLMNSSALLAAFTSCMVSPLGIGLRDFDVNPAGLTTLSEIETLKAAVNGD